MGRVTNKLIRLEFLLSIAIAVFTLWNKSNLVSLCFYCSFVVLLMATISVVNYRSQIKTMAIAIIVVSVFMIFVNSFSTGGSVNASNAVSFIVFASLLIFIYVLFAANVNYYEVNWIMNWGIVFSACFPIAYYVFNIKTYYAGFLSMNFSNSNLLGMWLLQAAVLSAINVYWQKGLIKKIICVGLTILNINLILLSGTRNALLALMLGAFIALLYIHSRKKYNNVILITVAALPIIFLIVYLTFYSAISNNAFLLKFMTGSKRIDARLAMWSATLYNLKGHYLTGSYFTLAGNVHNSHLVVLTSYGIVVLFMTIAYLYQVCSYANAQIETIFQRTCLTGFFITIFMGIGEGALFSGALGLYIPACIYIFLCRYNPDQEYVCGHHMEGK